MDTRFTELTLLISERGDIERDTVDDAWVRGGGTVLRVGGSATHLRSTQGDSRLRQRHLLSGARRNSDSSWSRRLMTCLADSNLRWLARYRVHPAGRHRAAAVPGVRQVGCAQVVHRPELRIGGGIARRSPGLKRETLMLASEFVVFSAEVRAFVLDGEVVTLAALKAAMSRSTSRAASHRAWPRRDCFRVVACSTLVRSVGARGRCSRPTPVGGAQRLRSARCRDCIAAACSTHRRPPATMQDSRLGFATPT